MKIDILGIQINNLTKEKLLHKLKNALILPKPIFIVTPYSEMVVAAQKDQEFKKILNSADFALPDGIGVLWAAKFLTSPSPSPRLSSTLSPSPGMERVPKAGEVEPRLPSSGLRPPSPSRGEGKDEDAISERGKRRGSMLWTFWELIHSLASIVLNPKYIHYPIPEKISGSEFIWDLCELASQKNYSIFLLGGFGDTTNLAAEALKSKYPNLKIAGTYAPSPGTPHLSSPTSGEELKEGGEVVQMINNSNADFLFVALGPIRQEKWICENLPRLEIKLAMGVGGTFDYLAQIKPYRPNFWARRGLEWLWRLLTQPWRIPRILKGIFGLIWYSWRARFTQRQ